MSRPGLTCVGDVLKAAGYDTGYIGKWHADYPYPFDRPDAALYLRNEPAPETELGYRPAARGVRTHRHTLVLSVDEAGQPAASLFFDREADPYEMNNLPLEDEPEITRDLLDRLAALLTAADDPWHRAGTLAAWPVPS